MPLNNLSEKFKSFNWNCIEVKDGHSFDSIIAAFNNISKEKKPTAIILNTIKAKGIEEFENDPVWHARKIKEEDIEIGKKKLGIK